ncbi:MAG TPA: prolipoprotein diacylglyceryl transferase family protein [Polyangiaceae bacterium]|nr:prolipoprotein diacylglyceryl transferase family protein [Polyangiaceae bacterium]
MFSAPAIPYLHIPELTVIPKGLIGDFPSIPFTIKPFGALVATGVYIGSVLATRQGRRLGLSDRVMASFIAWVVGVGFLGGHMLDVIFYYPGQVLRDPLSLIRVWEGLSSFGGFSGAIIGGFLWKWRYKADILPYADVIASSFPAAWVFGRTGCSVAHDHPGLPSDAWFAVQYPGGGRFDLGLYEMLLTIPLALAFLWLRKKPRPWGFYVGAITIAYAPVRFALDFLRVAEPIAESGGLVAAVDPRYAGLTPAQWACFGLLAVGVYFFARTLNTAGSASAFAPPPLPAALGGSPEAAAVTHES